MPAVSVLRGFEHRFLFSAGTRAPWKPTSSPHTRGWMTLATTGKWADLSRFRPAKDWTSAANRASVGARTRPHERPSRRPQRPHQSRTQSGMGKPASVAPRPRVSAATSSSVIWPGNARPPHTAVCRRRPSGSSANLPPPLRQTPTTNRRSPAPRSNQAPGSCVNGRVMCTQSSSPGTATATRTPYIRVSRSSPAISTGTRWSGPACFGLNRPHRQARR